METTIEKGSAIADPTILNENSYQTLVIMLSSNDDADHKMAQAILNRIKVNESLYFIWKLSKNYSYNMVYLRTKASRKFVVDANLWKLARLDETEFAEYLNELNILSYEIYQKLIYEIKNRIVRYNNNTFYDFHITIKEKYKHLSPEDKLTNITSWK